MGGGVILAGIWIFLILKGFTGPLIFWVDSFDLVSLNVSQPLWLVHQASSEFFHSEPPCRVIQTSRCLMCNAQEFTSANSCFFQSWRFLWPAGTVWSRALWAALGWAGLPVPASLFAVFLGTWSGCSTAQKQGFLHKQDCLPWHTLKLCIFSGNYFALPRRHLNEFSLRCCTLAQCREFPTVQIQTVLPQLCDYC